MKNLIIIRHAKSSWEIPLNDIDRPLSQKGIINAHFVAKKCVKELPSNFIIWSSTAKRASETALIFAKTILYPVESIVYKEDLYTFELNTLENSIKSCSDVFENLILFGHNEAITDFVNKFGDSVINNVPTAGFVFIEFDSDSWKNIKTGKTIKIIFPKNP